jgi:hypothetical protein
VVVVVVDLQMTTDPGFAKALHYLDSIAPPIKFALLLSLMDIARSLRIMKKS